MPFHLKIESKDVSRYVLTPGDQGRARKIATHLKDSYLVTEDRGYLVFSGWYEGVFVTVCGTGMGGPAVAIAVEELAQVGANTFIRVGSCGALQPKIMPGDIVLATGTVRFAGTGTAYLPLEFPAVPTFQVLDALSQAAVEINIPVDHGVVIAADAFYTPNNRMDLLKQAHILAIEMESDTLFIVGQYRGWRTGAIFVSDGTAMEIKPAWGEEAYRRGEELAIRIALRAVHKLSSQDN